MAGDKRKGDLHPDLPVGMQGGGGGAGGDGMVVASPPPMRSGTSNMKELFTDNLFKDAKNSVLTVIFGTLLAYITYRALGYVFFNARWEVIYNGPVRAYMLGPSFQATGLSELNIWIGVFLVAATFGLGLGFARDPDAARTPTRDLLKIVAPALIGVALILSMTRTITPTLMTIAAIALLVVARQAAQKAPAVIRDRSGAILMVLMLVAFWTLTGLKTKAYAPLGIGLPSVFPDFGLVNQFGGLLLTFVVAFAGITLSFPIGVTMALARRSTFPLIRPIAVGYIEFIRGVPLITLLFMGEFGIRFLFPPGLQDNVPGSVARAIIMITLFSGAYVAEVVRGGLQSVPGGQIEGGQAVGLQPLKITRLIVLPQALRNSIPALIGQFISLFKDTSLLIIIGLRDMLGASQPILASPDFANQGFTPEAYAFIAAIYWVVCFSMSRASQRLETRLGVGTR